MKEREPTAYECCRFLWVVDLDMPLALEAAKISCQLKLSLADSIIYATALHYDAVLWTQDEDFKGMKGVRYIPKSAK